MGKKSPSEWRRVRARRIVDAKLIVILRQIPFKRLEQTATALWNAGVQVVEVAMNSTRAVEQLRLLRGYGFCVGAGTILQEQEAEQAIQAGAQFLFSPICPRFFISLSRKGRTLGVPGALSPTEIYNLFRAGMPMIKLFPGVPFGPEYLREILAPLPSLQLIPTGGVTLDLAERFFCNGAAAVAVGREIASRSLVEAEQFDEITARARSFMSLISKLQMMSPTSQR